MRLLDRLSNTPLGHGGRQLRLGDAHVALADGVLVVEYGGQTHVTTQLQAERTSIVFYPDHVLIDLWESFGSMIRIGATSHELEAARIYFRTHGFAVYGPPSSEAARSANT